MFEREKDRKGVKVLLVEPPNLFPPDTHRRPNGSLGPVCLGGSLADAGFAVDYLDATVGTNDQNVKDIFFRDSEINEKGLVRVGMNDNEIGEAVSDYDIVAVTNIFTPQTNSTLQFGHIVKKVNPEAVLVAGGGNAWSLSDRMLDVYDAVGFGEGEEMLTDLVTAVARQEEWRNTPGFMHRVDGNTKISGLPRTVANLDQLPPPKFDLWPLDKYWEISAPHGGDFPPGMQVKYASIETSRGCPFSCTYCHISGQKGDDRMSRSGHLRLKSLDTVMTQVQALKGLGVEWLFFEDDSLLAKPKRAEKIFDEINKEGLNLAGMNGVNIVHFYQRNKQGKLEVNKALLESMAEAGFKQLVLPFESGSQRIINKYASGKWNLKTMNPVDLIREATQLGIKVPGNFMIGFPDESKEELDHTLELAEDLIEAGLTYASFFIVVPYPGSVLFDEAIKKGYLDNNFDPDLFHWGNPVMKNTVTPAKELIRLRKEMWREVNDPKYIKGKEKRQVIPESLED